MNTIRKFQIWSMKKEKLDLTFIHTLVPIDSQDESVNQVCICILRNPETLYTQSAVAVKHPNDAFDLDIAEHEAFKNLIEYCYYSVSNALRQSTYQLYDKSAWNKFSTFYRKQLYNAKKAKSDYEINYELEMAKEEVNA